MVEQQRVGLAGKLEHVSGNNSDLKYTVITKKGGVKMGAAVKMLGKAFAGGVAGGATYGGLKKIFG
ncbi:hypothetical protein IK3_05710 [Bacillus toyonensis]|nr:hypothetical protein IK3_05710 [Bacillus toyonensis]